MSAPDLWGDYSKKYRRAAKILWSNGWDLQSGHGIGVF